MNTGIQLELFDSLEDSEYRHAYVGASIKTGLANQIRLLRENRGWTQAELAERIGKAQATISLWENPDYGKYTISTLRDFAIAFDVALIVRFAPFTELAGWIADLTTERLTPPSYETERQNRDWGGVSLASGMYVTGGHLSRLFAGHGTVYVGSVSTGSQFSFQSVDSAKVVIGTATALFAPDIQGASQERKLALAS